MLSTPSWALTGGIASGRPENSGAGLWNSRSTPAFISAPVALPRLAVMSPGPIRNVTLVQPLPAGRKTAFVVKAIFPGPIGQDVKDTTVKGVKAAGEKTKDVGAAVGDKAEDVKDTTVKGTKVAAKKTKAVGKEAADKGEDIGHKTAKVAKSAGNWFTRAFKKIF